MFCTACGTRNIETGNYCKQCGHKLDHVTAPRISEEAFDRALPLDEQVTALMERAYRLRKTGELSSAVRLCEEALQLNPGSTSVHSLLGQIHEQMGNREAAIHEYERVLQLNPGSIADRVKLDELRGASLPTPLHPRTPPHIIMASQGLPNPSGRQILGIAGIAGVLMLLGGLIALQYNASHTPKSNTQIASASSRMPGINAMQPNTGAVVATGGPAAAAPATPTTGPVQPGAAAANNVASNTAVQSHPNTPTHSSPEYPRVIYIQSPSTPAANVRTGGQLPNLKVQKGAADQSDSETVHLQGDNGNGANIVINVPDKNNSENNGSVAQNPKNGGATAGKTPGGSGSGQSSPVIPPKLEIKQNNGNSGGETSTPNSDAQSHLAIASFKFKSGDFEGAIKAYSSALSGAGSQRAYVYQQMGICYQRIKNKTSAISSFNSAIDEYRKLEQANQQVDLAHAGIKVCENGIKLCNAE